ncbi:expressed unknown protein [Seminavis robusta]|uniref:Uncharacterized protein n=1 Tax=Seminavis robusta TaxID=568900 RepID=A0A9N8EM79_9STRA|nr:expressed unknown protein [Seminavis robusta]|eukprot:Sro1200_g251860.1 n/a (357) ;mRNA; f:14922-15992
MASNYAKGLFQNLAKSLRERIPLKTPRPRLTPPTTESSVSKAKSSALTTKQGAASYQASAKQSLDSWKQTVTSTPSYQSAKDYSDKLRRSTHQTAETLAKQISTDTVRSSLDKLATPAQQVLQKTTKSASDRIASTGTAARVAQQKVNAQGKALLQSSSERISKSVSTAAHVASSTVSGAAQSTKDTVVSELRVMRKDAFRWLWWWSLAAIAIYGVATTLPGELLREYHRRSDKGESQREKGQAREEEEVSKSKQPEDQLTRFSWTESLSGWNPFATSQSSNKDDDTKTQQQTSWFHQLGWPSSSGKKEQNVNNSTLSDWSWTAGQNSSGDDKAHSSESSSLWTRSSKWNGGNEES